MQAELKELNNRYACAHRESEYRRRTLSNGSTQYVSQCARCGRAVGTAIAAKVLRAKGVCLDNLPEFDEDKPVLWNENSNREKRRILGEDHETAKEELDEFWGWYREYLDSPKWQEKRKKVLKRANGTCEGCGDTEATEVHHLTYEHRGDEFLFELVALCKSCHEKVHSEHENRSLRELRSL